MKKILALILAALLCICCLASCGSAHKENEWFSEEKLTNCLVGDLPTITKDYVNSGGEDIYVSFTAGEREAYVAEVFEYLKSQNFKYLGTRGEQASTLAGSFTTYYFKPATELSEFYVGSSYKFVYSDGTLDEGGDPIFCILTIYDYEAKNLEYGTKNFAYNTLITLRYKSEAPLSGRYALNEKEHEHTITYVSACESGHFENYTCGCHHDHGAVPHYDENGDYICDACGYELSDIPQNDDIIGSVDVYGGNKSISLSFTTRDDYTYIVYYKLKNAHDVDYVELENEFMIADGNTFNCYISGIPAGTYNVKIVATSTIKAESFWITLTNVEVLPQE